MDDPNSQEKNYNPGLRLPRPPKAQESLRKKKIQKPASPKDVTPIIVNGNPVSREDITPIIDQPIVIQDSQNKIDLLETPNAIKDILEDTNYNEPQILNQVPIENDGVHRSETIESNRTGSDFPKTTSQIIEEQISQKNLSPHHSQELINDLELELINPRVMDIPDLEVKTYRRFNPPFPSDTPKLIPSSETPKQSRHMAAYIESVESTDTSTSGISLQPKITSPTDALAIDTKSQRQIKEREQRDREQREREQRDREQRDREQRDREQRDREQRDKEQRDKEQRDREQRDREQRDREQRDKEQRDKEQRDKEQRDKEQRDKEQRDREQREEDKPLTEEELISRAHDCYLKYQILQKSWQEYKFPNMDEKLVQTKPQLVIDTYNTSVERIQIDMDVNQYKIALIIMFLVIEVVCVKFLGFDAGGYTLSQIKAMNRYEKLLIEIGEKKMMIGGSGWPPEVRILFIGLLNCGLFILMKYLSSVLGPELVGYVSPIVNGLFSGALDTSKTANLPDELPQRQQDISGMLGGVASMAAKAFSGGSSTPAATNTAPTTRLPKASRRPVYRE